MLLSTKSYGDLCEFPDSWKEPFSFWDRMQHHTVDVSGGRAIELIKAMIEEYMALFATDKFNICADETFDLGKGKSKPLADEKGVHRLYIDYVKELCEFLVAKGKKPMFWGDIICAQPELIKELPEETVCLTWGYAAEQREHEAKVMAEAGARQYLCPGVGGWNQWMNLVENSYKNIARMCGYARKYHAEGVLNTDWGDCGHINQPDFSLPGMIYGAVFSWGATGAENSFPIWQKRQNAPSLTGGMPTSFTRKKCSVIRTTGMRCLTRESRMRRSVQLQRKQLRL